MRPWWITILRHAPPPRRSTVAIGLLVLAGSALAALAPWPMKLLVDVVLRPVPQAQQWAQKLQFLPGTATSTAMLIAWLAASGVILYLAAQSVRIAQSYLMTGLGSRLRYELGAELLERLQELSLCFHSRQRVGDMVRRVVSDSGCVRDLVCGVFVPGAAAIANLLIMFVIMLRMNAMLSLVAIAFAVPLIAVIRVFSRPMADRSHDQQQIEARIYSLTEQTLGAIPVVQSFTREPEQCRQFTELSRCNIAAHLITLGSQLQFKTATGAITAIGTATVMLIGGLHVIDGRMTVGSLLVFIAYLASLYAPLETLAYLASAYASASAGARRVLEVLESIDRVADEPGAVPLLVSSASRGLAVQLDHVSTGYRRPELVLHDIDVEIEPGQVVALVGPTGAGKSTLVSLVPRLMDPWCGRVKVGGSDVRDLTLASLRHHVAVVPQEALLLPVSVADNIAYARPEAGDAEIRRAAEAAGAAEFIERMPDGYATLLGQRGATLSVGQRQRLAIARALLKDAPVLILDEPTSALDTATEHGVVEALRRLLQGRTCLIIAHRLSTIRYADRVLVLDAGRIVQDGPPARLAREPGLFQHFRQLQFGLDPVSTAAVTR